MWSLSVEAGKHQGRRVNLTGGRVVIGRAEDAQIRVGSTDVSRYHCELIPSEHGVLVNDLESVNGTLINGEKITTEFLLAPGNTLTVGPLSFRLLPKADDSKTRDVPGGMSDDEISDLLSGEIATLQSDTTIVGASPEESPENADEPPEPPVDTGPQPPPPSKMEFESVAEEAADIIRRHYEMVAAMEADEESLPTDQ